MSVILLSIVFAVLFLGYAVLAYVSRGTTESNLRGIQLLLLVGVYVMTLHGLPS